jgi:hypothetical protein
VEKLLTCIYDYDDDDDDDDDDNNDNYDKKEMHTNCANCTAQKYTAAVY